MEVASQHCFLLDISNHLQWQKGVKCIQQSHFPKHWKVWKKSHNFSSMVDKLFSKHLQCNWHTFLVALPLITKLWCACFGPCTSAPLFQNNFAFSFQEIRVWNMRKSQIPKPGPFQILWWVWGFYFIYSFIETGSFERKYWAILIFVPFWTDIMVWKCKECTVEPGVGRRSWQKYD